MEVVNAFSYSAFTGVWHRNEGAIAMKLLHFSTKHTSKLHSTKPGPVTLLSNHSDKIGLVK
jgi:hypothetical protein